MRIPAIVFAIFAPAFASAATVNVDVRDLPARSFVVISAVPGQGTNQCTVNAGDTVVWTWMGNFHSVTSDTGLFDSGVQNVPHSFQFTFNNPGTFGYHCVIHGAPGVAMFGVINVVQPPCPGDIDGNRQIDIADLAILLAHFGTQSGATAADGDMNGDGAVDLTDLAFLLSRFGIVC